MCDYKQCILLDSFTNFLFDNSVCPVIIFRSNYEHVWTQVTWVKSYQNLAGLEMAQTWVEHFEFQSLKHFIKMNHNQD